MKMTATQGVIFATLVLATIGGALQVLATELQTVDLSWMGSYQTPFLAFFQNAWIIVVVTFLYNVFMYFRRNQLAALKQTAELYDWRKLVTTLAWFVGILGPMAALVSDVQVKGIISLIVVLATAFTQEISKIFGADASTPTSATSTPTTPTAPSTTNASQQTLPEGQIGTYQGWGVYIKNGYLMVYPPSNMVATFGQMMALGSVQGYPPTTDFMSMAKTFIDQQIAQYNYQQAHPPNPAQEPQPPQPVTPAA
jgi:hypothetical protein